jgi:hypothetical protein
MGKALEDFSGADIHTPVCDRPLIPQNKPVTRLKVSFGGYKPLSFTLEIGICALLDTIACLEGITMEGLVRRLDLNKDPWLSLSESVTQFTAHYFYRKALSPLSDPMQSAFKLPGLKLKNRGMPLNLRLFKAWKERAGLGYLKYSDIT